MNQFQQVSLELAAGLFSAVGVAGFYWLHDAGKIGGRAFRSFNAEARLAWLEGVLRKPGSEMLAIQTLRNSIMAATVMASTSVLLLVAVLTLMSDPEKFAAHWLAADQTPDALWLWKIKIAALLLTFFFSFWHFSMSVRVFNHTGYLLSTPGQADDAATVARIAKLLNTAGGLYSTGNRFFFFAAPLALWWFGAIYCLLATGSLMLATWLLDWRAISASLD